MSKENKHINQLKMKKEYKQIYKDYGYNEVLTSNGKHNKLFNRELNRKITVGHELETGKTHFSEVLGKEIEKQLIKLNAEAEQANLATNNNIKKSHKKKKK
tara:strand:+ start:38 stop:340 length:303 start_codon:yes stop_codon:yes gene_type:complete